jgi:hypothetical protein
MAWVRGDCEGRNPCGGSSWVRLPSTAPAGFRAPMGGAAPLPMPPPGSRGVRRKQPRAARSMPVYRYGRGAPFYMTPAGPAYFRAGQARRLEGFAGELIEGCGEKYEQAIGRNPTTGAPLNDPCRGSMGVTVFCGEADAEGWSQVLLGPAVSLVRARYAAVRVLLADFPGDNEARGLVNEAGGWITAAHAAPTTSMPFAGQKAVDEITTLIRRGACLASQFDAVIVRMRAAGAKTRKPIPTQPGGTTEPEGGLPGALGWGALAIAGVVVVGLILSR